MTNRTTLGGFLIGAAVLAASPVVASAEDGQFSVGAGIDYSSGDYGTSSTTDILSIPVFGKYETGPWAFKLTVPYTQITSEGNVLPGIGRVNAVRGKKAKGAGAAGAGSTATTLPRETESGLGDIVAAATYNVFARGATVIDLTGKIKFGTADADKGLGTGQNDYSVQVDGYQTYGRFTALATLGYSVLGSSDAIQLDNVFYASVGGAYKFTDLTSGGLTFDFRQAPSATSGERRELTAYVAHKLSGAWKAQAYVLKGFADGSPDYGVGATVTRSF